MLLKQWSKRFGILPTQPTTECGAVSVMIDCVNLPVAYQLLWRLDDYKVSSACGAVVWLKPNRKFTLCSKQAVREVYGRLTPDFDGAQSFPLKAFLPIGEVQFVSRYQQLLDELGT